MTFSRKMSEWPFTLTVKFAHDDCHIFHWRSRWKCTNVRKNPWNGGSIQSPDRTMAMVGDNFPGEDSTNLHTHDVAVAQKQIHLMPAPRVKCLRSGCGCGGSEAGEGYF